jgi:hypothetical protein
VDLFRVDRERAFTFTIRTVADLDLLRGVLIEWTQDSSALSAVEFDVLELREHTGAPGHDASDTNEVIQVARTEVAERRAQWQVSNPDMDFGVNALVVGIVHQNGGEGDLVKNGKHRGG